MLRAICLSSMLLLACLDRAQAQSPPPQQSQIVIPAEEGRLAVRDLIGGLFQIIHMEPPGTLANLDWTIDIATISGKLQLAVFDHLARGAIDTDRRDDAVIITFDPQAIEQRGEEIGESIAGWLGDLLGRDAEIRRFGMSLVTEEAPRAPIAGLPPSVTRAVVLVHGLDDPGWMWNDLSPQLTDAGHTVVRFEYPNDQPIPASADLFATELGDLRARGVDTIDIVAHSMGGLVARDVLTRPEHYGSDGSGRDRFPAVERLIMLGTPNGGSQMARLRSIGELWEQIDRWFTDANHAWLDGATDGSGEAGTDLLPGSDFLLDLNARPAPRHIAITIIAGRASPVDDREIDSFMWSMRSVLESQSAPGWLQELLNDAAGDATRGVLHAAVRGLGDGVVTLQSAQLQGVEDTVIVEANHLSMIASVGERADVPPAIPIVLERLGRE